MKPLIKNLGIVDYAATLSAMQNFTNNRTPATPDEFWILEHPPIFTQGLAGKPEHILQTTHNIPIVNCDRGGQVTYHAPGQIIVYILLDLRRAQLSIRDLVTRIENGVIAYLASLHIQANGDRCAPGVYVATKKIASLGLKVRKGYTYHGLSFNINMDLTPFNYINVCGYKELQVTQLCDIINVKNNYTTSNHEKHCVYNHHQNHDITPTDVAPILINFLLQSIYDKN